MPVRQVEDVALALEDGDQLRDAEQVGVQKAGQVAAPAGQVVSNLCRQSCALVGGDGLDRVQAAQQPVDDLSESEELAL